MIYLPTMVTSHGVKKLPQGSNFALGELPVELPPLGFGFHLWIGPKKTWALPSYTPNRPCWGCCKESADSAGDLAVVSSGKMAKLGANHKGYGGFLKYGYPQIIHFRSF